MTECRDPTGAVVELAGGFHPAHHNVSKRSYKQPVDAGFDTHRALRISQGHERRILEDQTLCLEVQGETAEPLIFVGVQRVRVGV